MSFSENISIIAELYRRSGSARISGAIQYHSSQLLYSLNQYRIAENFNGYEREWRKSKAYSRFIQIVEYEAFLKSEYEINQFYKFIDHSIEYNDIWIDRMNYYYDKNFSRFRYLIERSQIFIPKNIVPLYGSGNPNSIRYEALALTECILRLYYFSHKKGKHNYYRWRGKSYIILFSKRFSEYR